MHRSPNPVADKFPNDAETVAFHIILHRARNVHHAIARHRLRNSFCQSLFRHIHQPLRPNIAPAHGHRFCRVPNIPAKNNANVQTDNVAKFQAARASQPMHHLLIDRNTNMARILAIPQKRALCPVTFYPRRRKIIHFFAW